MYSQLLDQFQKQLTFYRSPRLLKLLRSPLKLLSVKFFELFSRTLHLPLNKKAKLFWHPCLNVVIPEKVSMQILQYGFFEEGLTAIFLQYVKPGMIYYEIGPHYGYFTLLAYQLIGTEGQIHAFEPTKYTYQVLKSNTDGKTNIVINNLAVYSTDGYLEFNDYGIIYSAFNSFYNSKLNNKDKKSIKTDRYNVQTVCLDHYIEKSGVKPDFIKIDAESAELEILKGMKTTLRTIKPLITVEVGDQDVPEASGSHDVVKFLLDHGYSAFEYSQGKIIPHQLKEKYGYENLLFKPS